MKTLKFTFIALGCVTLMASCVSKKKYAQLKVDYEKKLTSCEQDLAMEKEKHESCEAKYAVVQRELNLREDQVAEYKDQLSKQMEQVGDLTVLSQSANQNINQTLSQLEQKDQYIRMLQAAKDKADSINLALAVNLKGVLKEGIEDDDVNIEVDKTVVFINLSDKMLFETGSYELTDRAHEVLAKIAKVVKSRPNFEVMVEGYTDDRPISTSCMKDNWDLSVYRSTSVVRELQDEHKVDPNRLIAAGRGQYNALASNDSKEGRAKNRRTRIVILPKLGQFYELLDPEQAMK